MTELDWAGAGEPEESISLEDVVADNNIEVDFSVQDNKRKNSMFLDKENNIRNDHTGEEIPLISSEGDTQHGSASNTQNDAASDSLNQVATETQSQFTAESLNQNRTTAEPESQSGITEKSKSDSQVAMESQMQSTVSAKSHNENNMVSESLISVTELQSRSRVAVAEALPSVRGTDESKSRSAIDSKSYVASESQYQSSIASTTEPSISFSSPQNSSSVSQLIGQFENMAQKNL